MAKNSDQKTNQNRRRRFKLQAMGNTGVVLSSGGFPSREGPTFGPLNPCSPNSTTSNLTFSSNGGSVLKNVHVHLIYWGSAWAGNLNALAGQITNAVQNMLAGPYMTYLAQYGVGRGSLYRTTYVTDRGDPSSTGFTKQNVQDLLNLLLDDSDNTHLPEPDEAEPLFYCVIMPPTATFNQNNILGQNWGFTWADYDLGDVDNDPATMAWIGNNGTLDYVTEVLSHELVESCTDPYGGQGIVQTTPTCTGSSCQIGDPCTNTCDRVSGVKVQGYWSEADKRCITPNWYSVRRTLPGRDFSQGINHVLSPNAPITSLTTLVASLF
jgi:hypothetical protein